MADELEPPRPVAPTPSPQSTTGPAGVTYPHIIKATWTQFSGQIPHPATLSQYEDVMPGLPRTLVDEWLAEVAHRRAMDIREQDRADIELERDHRRHWRGMHLGLSALLIGSSVAFYAIHAGQGVAGAAIIVTEIAAVAIAFITGRSKPIQTTQDEAQQS